jgi:hypothetical protein
MMSQSNSNLPSVNDFVGNLDNLPSIDDIIIEKSLEEIPSVKEFIQKEVEDIVEKVEEPVIESSSDLTELLRLINDVRKDIPEIPKIKCYDEELEKLCEIVDQVRSEIPTVPEVKYYDTEIETICEQIDNVKEFIASSISKLPEVKYYDYQIEDLEEKLENIKNTISELPEVRYYENDLKFIREEIEKVKRIVVSEIPDFSWVDRTFKSIDDDLIKINDNVSTLKEGVNLNLDKLSEVIDVKRFESKVEIDGLDKNFNELNKNFQEAKDNIWKELRASSLKIWEYHKEFKDDDRKLKKQINGEYNLLKQNLDEKLKKINQESVQTDELLFKYFSELKEQVSTFPEVKYYDNEIVDVRKEIISVKVDISELYKIVRNIKSSQKDIKEGLLNEPPDTKNLDPLTPLDQNFATLDDLQNHYRLFINRIQQQLSTLGGGGETRLEFLDDVDRNSAKVNGRFLKYDSASDKWIGAAGGGGSQTLDDTLGIGNTSSLGMSVGIITATYFIGDGSLLTNLPGGGGIATAARTLVSNEASILTGVTTTTTISETPIDTFSSSTYRSAKYLIQITEGTSYHATEISIIHDGSTTYSTEYGTIKTNELLSTFDSDITTGNVRLLATPASSSSTTFKIVRTSINS